MSGGPTQRSLPASPAWCRAPAQPAFPSAWLSQGQMTSFLMAWSLDSPVPVSSESIRQVPLSTGTSILIWKKLRRKKKGEGSGRSTKWEESIGMLAHGPRARYARMRTPTDLGTDTHACAHPRKYVRICTHVHTHGRVYAYARMRTPTDACTHDHACAHPRTCIHIYMCAHEHMYTYMCVRNPQTCTHIHVCAHPRT